jgi:aminoacrylate hydrolase
MKLSVSPPPYDGAPAVVLIAGLGGGGSYWLPQLARLEQEYQVVCYDQRGTGNNPDTLPEGYSMAEMAQELAQALARRSLAVLRGGPRAGGADWPATGAGLSRSRYRPGVRQRLAVAECPYPSLLSDPRTSAPRRGAQAWVEAQPLFLYPADWMAARAPRMEAEESLALAHFQGKHNLLRRLTALKQANFSRHAARIRCPVHIICSADDLLVPSVCSSELQAALPGSQKVVMRQGGHACNVTEPDTFNTLLLNGLASLLHSPEPAL